MGILRRLFKKKPKAHLREMAGDFKLPAFPKVAMEVRALLRSDSSTNEQIGACIKRDAGLTIQLLKSVNSAASTRQRRIADPVQAVGLVGRANLEFMVLAHATREALSDAQGTGFSGDEFWHIATQRASLAEHLCREIRPADAGVAYAASMLQDMAVPVLAKVMRDTYRPMLLRLDGDWSVLDEQERDTLGFDHGEFGGWMCEAWAFPDLVTSAVASHHRDVHDELEVPDAVRAVAFLNSARPTPEEADQLVTSLDETYGISPADVRRLLELHFGAEAA